MGLFYPFLTAFLIAAAATPLMIAVARRMGWMVEPRDDRWHKRPTAVFGGVAIYLAYIISFLFAGPRLTAYWVLIGGASAIFGLGLLDDARELKPQVKFLAQLLVAIVTVSQGVSLDREVIPWPWVSIPLAVLWLVGITNAVNILDNMDGLASGVVLVASTALAVGSVLSGSFGIGHLCAMLAGAALGFFLYNFNPARIFMGDCGSMFLGFTLAGLTILSTNTAAVASQLTMAVLVPLGALVVPIFDTSLVSFERTTHGRSIAQGGRDHSSHRLVFLGLSERKAVIFLLLISAGGGFCSILLTRLANPLTAAVVVAVFLVLLVFFGVYLGEVKVYDAAERRPRKSPILDRVILHKKQILQISADLVLLSAAFTAAWLLRYEGSLPPLEVQRLAQSLPWLLAAKMGSFWLFGLYRGEWRYISIYDLVQILKACTVGSLVTVFILILFYRFQWYSRAVMVIDFFLAFMFVAGARCLIRVFREKVRGERGLPVLIFGAGDGGELLLRELRNNPLLPYVPVGFVDDDTAKKGRVIHGITVLGTRKDLSALIARHRIERVFISILSSQDDSFPDVFEICRKCEIECTRIQPLIKL